jgi:hypothetical protein
MRKEWIEDLNCGRQEVTVANNEKAYTEGTGGVMVKLKLKIPMLLRKLRMLLCSRTND